MSETKYSEWSILELLGHRRLAGLVTEQEIAGKGFLRIDVPTKDGKTVTQFYSPDSVYGLTPTTEDVARQVAELNTPAPVERWELPERTQVQGFRISEPEPADLPDDDELIEEDEIPL